MFRALLAATSLLALSPAVLAQPDPALRAAAEAGDADAAFDYGYELTFPETGEPDHLTGRYWLTRAADGGSVPANYILGQIYLEGIGTDPEPDRARAFFELAWQAGDVPAGYALAELLLYDYEGEEAAAIVILEALLDDPDMGPLARLSLADTLFFGSDDDRQAVRAVALAREALDQDPSLTSAHYLLGIAAMEGLGRAPDPQAALQHWRDGTMGGDTLAMLALADALMDGVAGEPDPVEARALYGVAAAFGDPDAEDAIAGLDAGLTEQQRSAATIREGVLLDAIG
jgi:hypothetical protein